MISKIKKWIKNHDTWLLLIGYVAIVMALIIFLPSNYFPSIYHLPKMITYLLILTAPILILLISYLVMLLSYAILGLSALMLVIPEVLMTVIYGLFMGIMFVIAGVADGVEHLCPKKISSNVALLISIGFIGVIIISVSIATMLFSLF